MPPDRPTLPGLLAAAASAAPDAPAVRDERVTLSFSALEQATARLAGGLAARGIGAGDRVAMWLPNRAEYLVLLFALARLGAIAVSVNTRYRSGELRHALARSGAKALALAWGFAGADFPTLLAELAPGEVPALAMLLALDRPDGARAPLPGLALHDWAAIADAAPASDRSSPDAACVTFNTSGTTSGPKLVVHDQGSIAGHAAAVAAAFGFDRPRAALYAALPFCGTFGLTAALGALAGGAMVRSVERFDAAEAERIIRAERLTHIFGPDDMIRRLVEAANGLPFAGIRCVGYAAFAPGPRALVEAGAAVGLPCCGLYGSSEVQALFARRLPDAPAAERATAGGLLVSPATEVRVRDRDSGALLPPGEAGELEFRGPSLFRGYWNDPEATERAFTADGWFRSGDLGRLESDGGFAFETRLGDALRLGGFLVGPEEIEGFLKAQPGVAEAQVVAAEAGGRAVPVAFVLAADPAAFDAEALRTACAGALARFKVPERIVAVEAFPLAHGPNGVKIQRNRLREMAQALLAKANPLP